MATYTLNNKETIAHRKKWIDCYKVSRGCDICGYNKNPRVLCFDHLPEFEKAEVTKKWMLQKELCWRHVYALWKEI